MKKIKLDIYGWLLIGVLACKGISTDDLLNANFVSRDKTGVDLLSPPNNSVTQKNPQFTWTKRTGATSYLLEISSKSDLSSPLVQSEVTTTSSSATVTAGYSYYWRVTTLYKGTTDRATSSTYVFHVLDDNIIYASAASSASDQIGNKNFPIKSVQDAISQANILRNNVSTNAYQIYVAQGTYTEEINLEPGISLRGGYEATNWTRSISSNTTILTSATNTAIRSGGSITSAYTSTTVVEGFTINGGSSSTSSYGIFLAASSPKITQNTINGSNSGTASYAIYCSAGSQPQITGNIITGGSVAANSQVYAIYNLSSSPVISTNTINGGNNSSGPCPASPNVCNSYGIYNSSSNASITNNTISGGTIVCNSTSTCNTYGIYNSASSPTISTNSISGGSMTGSSASFQPTYAVYSDSSAGTISANNINGGSQLVTVGDAYAINLTNSSTPTITGNAISGGSSTSNTYGIAMFAASAAIISNNTINGGAAGSQSQAIYVQGSAPDIQNNILFTVASPSRYGVRENTTTSDPVTFKNNLLFDAPFALYFDEGTTQLNTIGTMCASLTASGTTTCSGLVGSSASTGNVFSAGFNINDPKTWTIKGYVGANNGEADLDHSGGWTTGDIGADVTKIGP